MIEFELLLKEVEKLHEKEKSLRRKLYLENAIHALREYSRSEPK